jgi:hypothetical protein
MKKVKLDTIEKSPDLEKVFSNRINFARKIIRQQIINKSGIVSKNGYVTEIEDNLIPTIAKEDFFTNLEKGNGNELNSKFKALYSSSALCVNFFGFFKRHLDKFVLLGESNFNVGRFEEKLSTGMMHP